MNYLKVFLIPFTVIYSVIIFIRNRFYDYNILRSKEFNITNIIIGNLTTGGTGKTPHTEYIVNLLQDKYKVATLSRGYGRKTRKYILSDENSSYLEIGDEPLQIKNKFKNIAVAVDRNRVNGMTKTLKLRPDLDIIILDDAFQHRSLKPGLSILLTDYNKPFWNNWLLPIGTLREHSFENKRADIIIVTKTPSDLTPIEQRVIKEDVKPRPYQQVFLSYIKYNTFKPFYNDEKRKVENNRKFFSGNYDVILFTGIANAKPLIEFLEKNNLKIMFINYPDHHNYTKVNVLQIVKAYEACPNPNKIILTTEKDMTRLLDERFKDVLQDLPIYYVPISIGFHNEQEELFDKMIIEYVRKNTIFKQWLN